VPVIAFHGTGDYSSLYEGSDLYASVPHWAKGWASRNGCDATPTVIHQKVDVQRETWNGCEAGAAVTLYTIQGGIHAWPRSAIDAAAVLWDFLEAHPRPPAQAEGPGPVTTPVVGAIHDRPGDYFERLIHRSYPRWFKVHIPPSYQPGERMALVFSLHGLGADLEQQERLSDLSAKADEAGFIVVYPQAGARVWNIQAGEIGAIDVGFFRALIAYLETQLSIDPARIYATGFSNGGGMAHRLACDLSDRIAAIATVSGAYSQEEPCEPLRPVPVLAFHSETDRYAPFVNEQLGIDIPRWAADWAGRNGCAPEPVASVVQQGVTAQTWQGCRQDATVSLYVIEQMGHTWPGSPAGRLLGPYALDLEANDLIWDFFQAH
jgi:polyhydroxybutyrate depolymerase